jgi:serine/threonine protein kinase
MKSCPTCQNSYPTEFMVCPQDGTSLVEVGVWSDGSVVIGKYRILNKIGQGGMGVVYKAVHVAFEELRALKVMHPNLMTDESFVKRFRHEARITRRLQHPNAVRVDDIEEADDGRPFIVMEYIEGRSLKSLIYQEGALQVPRVCSIVRQVAAALGAAHELGMIHRDIKPENIVLLGQPPHEQAKVLDFGIAKIKEGRLGEAAGMTLTGAGVVVGTPQYMSPEQAAGKRGDELDGRSDLYSLGVVMYQMLSGELPFHADTTMEMLIAHMQRPPMALQLVHPNLVIPDAISNLVMRLLEKNPSHRPANARALIEELDVAEKAAPALNATRVSAPEQVYSPEAAARALRESLDSGIRSPARHHTPRPPEIIEQPTPAPPAPGPVVARPQPPPAPVVQPAPVAQPKSSHWALWIVFAVVVIGAAGGGAWYFMGRQSAVAPPTQNQTVTPTGGGQSQQPAQNPTDTEKTAEPAASSAEPPMQTATPNEQPAAAQKKPASAPPQKASRTSPAKPAVHQPETQRNVSTPANVPPATKVSPPPEEAKPAPPVVDERAVKAALAMGNLYYDRGDYDSAINEFQKGLRADPSNSVLQGRIQAAKRAKAAEERLRQ